MKLLLTALALATQAAPNPARMTAAEQAIRDYHAVTQGTRRLEDMTPAERARVAEIDRLLRAQRPAPVRPGVRCREAELRQRGANPTELERRIIDLRCGPQ